MKYRSTNDGLEKTGFKKILIALAILLACLPQFVLAQEVGEAEGAAEEEMFSDTLEEIVVTGSNIRRDSAFAAASPVTVLTHEAIEAAGIGQMQDILRLLPAVAGAEINAAQTTRMGTSQFVLRGLGVGGTLTLINGRRAGLAPVTTTQGFFYTDINQYPPNMIESIEVLKDGASAIYGSEAVGGVVNLKTRTRFEGMEVGGEYRGNENNPAGGINAAFGSSFERGHFSVFLNFYSQSRGYRGDYDWLTERSNALLFDGDLNEFSSGTGSGRYDRAIDPDGDGFYERIGNTVPDPNCEQPNPLSGITNTFFAGTNCRYGFVNQRALVPEEKRIQMFTQFDYDVRDNVQIWGEMSYSNNEIKDIIGGAVMDLRFDDGGHYVPADHPFNYFVDNGGVLTWDPDAVAVDPSQAVDVIFRGRPLTTYDGDLAEDITRQFDNTRLVLGFDADLSTKWSLNGSYVYSRSKMTDIQPRSYYTPAFRDAIADHTWNPFASASATPGAVSVKDGATLAGNTVFGSDSDLSSFATNRTFVRETTYNVLEAIVSGEAFNVNDNPVLFAFGLQYRDMKYSDIADSLSAFRIDGRTDPVFSIVNAKQDVYAIFGEAVILATDALEIQLAVRYEDYGDDQGGDSTDPKLGINWNVTDSLMLRGTIGTSFQAPSIRNIAGAVGSGVLPDPILASVWARGPGASCDSDKTDSFNSSQITLGGGLKPQSATNYNLGAVYNGDNFTGSIDYWNYKFDDLIGPGEAFGSIVAGECSNGVFVPDPRVGRDSSGQLRNVTTRFINLGGVDADGLDFYAAYAFQDVLNGQLILDASATYINSFDIDFGDGSPEFDGANNRNAFIDLLGSVPDFRMNLGASWISANQFAGFYIRHIGGYDDREPDVDHDSIGHSTLLDINYGYTFDELLGSGATNVSVGINNLTDKDPPAIDLGSNGGRIGFDQQVFDPRGRVWYVRFLHTF